jgi:hypothetical protein
LDILNPSLAWDERSSGYSICISASGNTPDAKRNRRALSPAMPHSGMTV